MILNHYFKYFLLIFISLFLFYFEALANDNLDSKVKSLTLELRCMTCQNQSIYDSDAEFSNDIKKIIKRNLKKEILNMKLSNSWLKDMGNIFFLNLYLISKTCFFGLFLSYC